LSICAQTGAIGGQDIGKAIVVKIPEVYDMVGTFDDDFMRA
jgi:hypothetical protein